MANNSFPMKLTREWTLAILPKQDQLSTALAMGTEEEGEEKGPSSRLFRTLKYRTPVATLRELLRLHQVSMFRIGHSQAEVMVWIVKVFLRTGFSDGGDGV